MTDAPTTLFVDAQHLVYLAKSGGIDRGQQAKAATAAGKMALNSHLFSNFECIVTDAVLLEATRKSSAPDARLLVDWATENGLKPLATTVGQRMLQGEKIRDGGEKSIVEAIGNLRAGQSYFIVVDDKRNRSIWTEGGIAPEQKISTVAYLDMVHDFGAGTLPTDQYAAIALGLKRFVPEAPNLDLFQASPLPTAVDAVASPGISKTFTTVARP